jgi:CRP-like cAMP-binding protein
VAQKNSWLQNILQIINHQDEKTVHNLRRFPPFQAIADSDIQALAKRCHIRHFNGHEEIYAEKSPSAAVYFIIYGSIGLYKKRRNSMTDRVQAIKAGHFFGESSLIQNIPRTHSAKALEKTQVIVLFQADFKDLEFSHPRLALLILKLVIAKISRELQIFQTEFHELSNKVARDQLLD